MEGKNTDLTQGNIVKSIIWFSIPLLVGNLFQQLYNAVDSYVVGNYVGKAALAAVGASTPVINMLIGFLWELRLEQELSLLNIMGLMIQRE